MNFWKISWKNQKFFAEISKEISTILKKVIRDIFEGISERIQADISWRIPEGSSQKKNVQQNPCKNLSSILEWISGGITEEVPEKSLKEYLEVFLRINREEKMEKFPEKPLVEFSDKFNQDFFYKKILEKCFDKLVGGISWSVPGAFSGHFVDKIPKDAVDKLQKRLLERKKNSWNISEKKNVEIPRNYFSIPWNKFTEVSLEETTEKYPAKHGGISGGSPKGTFHGLLQEFLEKFLPQPLRGIM